MYSIKFCTTENLKPSSIRSMGFLLTHWLSESCSDKYTITQNSETVFVWVGSNEDATLVTLKGIPKQFQKYIKIVK